MPFAPPPFVRADIDRSAAGLVQPVVYRGRDDTFTVPAGFVTDFASVPRFMTWLIPTMGAYTRASIVHDWLCTRLEQEWVARPTGAVPISRLRAWAGARVPASARDTDGIFRRICREEGTPLIRRWLLWCGVRWGALGSPARRPGWWRDAPAVLAISLLALPFVLLPALFVALTLLVDDVVERIR